jgi:hypothetical protein
VRTTVQESPDRFAVVATVGGTHQLWGTAVHDDADRLFDALKVSRRLDFGPQSGNHLRVMSWGDWCKVRVGLGLGEEPEPTAPADLIDCAALREHVETLAVSLAQWAYRDDSKAQPEVRQAANVAVESIDAALRELHRVRQRLVGEMRQSDDAAMRRSGELLARIRAEREAGTANG